MKKTFKLGSFVAIMSLVFLSCAKKEKDNNSLLVAGLALMNQGSGGGLSSQYSNSVSGSSTAVQGSSASSAASSSATSNATSGASAAAASVLEPSLRDAIAKSKSIAESRVVFNTTTCNGSTQTVTGTYTTQVTITNASLGASSYLTSGSFTITPNITTKITFTCSFPSNTTSDYTQTMVATYANSGSLDVTFASAAIKYFDIEAYVKSGTFSIATVTLSGTVSVSNIAQAITSNSTTKYTSSTGTSESTMTLTSTSSDKSTSSNLVVGSNAAATFDLTSASGFSFNVASKSTGLTSCYTAFNVESGSKTSGTYNGEAVTASYYLNNEDYKKLVAANGTLTIAMCQ